MVQYILSVTEENLGDFLTDVVEQGGNLGAFKQLWRKRQKIKNKHTKKGIRTDTAKIPLNNIEAHMWEVVGCGSCNLKSRRKQELNLFY